MARYYYRYRRSYRRRPRRYIRRWFKRRFSRFVNGTSRSVARIKTSFVQTLPISAGYGSTAGDVFYSSPFSSVAAGALSNSQLYRTYCSLYEEVKIIGVKISVAVVTPVGDTATPSLQIYTAWDRKHAAADDVPTADSIVSSSTYNVATALNNNVAKITRSCYASDLMEKATWIDASLNGTYGNFAWAAGGANCPCFCPSFQMTLVSPSLGAAHNVTVSVSYTYYLAFRNPKFGGGASSAKDVSMPTRSVSFADAEFETLDEEDGDMDTKAGDAELAAAATALRTARLEAAHSSQMEKLRADSRARLMGDKVIQKR